MQGDEPVCYAPIIERRPEARQPAQGRGFQKFRGMVYLWALRKFFRGFFYYEVNMYAVIKTGGKQYRVATGEKIKVEQIAADVGQEIVIDQVLAVGLSLIHI